MHARQWPWLLMLSSGCVLSGQSLGSSPTINGAPSSGGATDGGSAGGGTTSSGGSGSGIPAGGGSGGSSGSSSGSTPAPDQPLPVIVGDCDNLGAVDVFEDMTFSGFDPTLAAESGYPQGITSVAVDPVHSGTVYLGTDSQGLYKSTDCGKNWTAWSTGTNSDMMNTGIIWTLVVDPQDPTGNTIYSQGLYTHSNTAGANQLLKSSDGGVSWAPIFTRNVSDHVGDGGWFQGMSMDPTNHLHILVTFHQSCSGNDPDGNPYNSNCQGETTDGGVSWALLNGSSELSGFLEGAGPHVLGPKTWLMATEQNGVYYTNDGGTSYAQVQGFSGMNSLFIAADNSYFAASDYGTWHATDPAGTWTIVDGAQTSPVIGDGSRIFVGMRLAESSDSTARFRAGNQSTAAGWAALSGPNIKANTAGPVAFAYDVGHHILFSANQYNGATRMVAQ